jgi:hypothetical protein
MQEFDDEGMEIEDMSGKMDKKKKKINSGVKGKRKEREIVHLLNERFASILIAHPTWGAFSRSVGSGNRWGQRISLSQHAKETYSGDITCPENFKFVLESKGGYNDVDLNSAFDGGHSQIDTFLKQVSDDSSRCNRKPMLIWKKDRRPRLAALRKEDLEESIYRSWTYWMNYREWGIFLLDDVLKLEDKFFFEGI